MKAKHNGNTSQAHGAPAHVATTAAEVVDKWAATVFDAGNYSAAEHAELAGLVLGRRIPVLGEVTPDGKIVWYGKPPTRQAE